MRRRALSTVVGTVFAIIALTSTVTYITYSMGILDNYNQSILAKNQQSLDIGNEKFQVTGTTIVNNRFNITVTNTGNIPINFTKIWIQNTTGVDWVRSYVPPSNIVTPGGILKNIGQNIPVSAVSTQSYNIKMVTSRGNSYQFYVNSPNLTPVPLQIIAAPSIVPTGFQTTLILTVTNNMTNNAALTNVIPAPLSIVSNNGITSNCNNPTPASYSNIPVGTTAMFQWTCTLSGSVGTAITYNASLQSGYNHNYALSTITIGNVLFAEQSASSLGAQSLSQASNTNQKLIFDQNHYSVPYGGYQMFSTQADNNTNNPSTDTFLQVDPNGESFYTNNGTATTISPGKWNATLRYISAPVPSSFSSNQYPDVIYHFESNFNKLGNSIGSGSTMTTHNNPGWTSTSGVNNTGSYTLANGNQYLDANVAGGYTDIPSGNTKTNTAMWFKTSASCAGTCTLLRIGDSNAGPYYIIYISNHNITFKFSDHNNNNGQGGQIDATCTKAVTVDDQKWHYLVAEKTGNKNCDLYIDGSHAGTTFTQGSSCSGGECSSVSGHFDIGRDQSSNNNYFSGNIDDFIHWNGGWNNNLSQTQVTDLLKTSYGANAHTVNMFIYDTDQSGNCPSGGNGGLGGNCQDIIVQNLNYQLPFMDGWYYGGGGGTISYTTPSASSTTWGHYNYTATLGEVDVSTTQRIEFQTKFVTQVSGQLGMKMIIDNTGLVDQYGQSLLETPSLSSPFMGYYSYLSYDSGQCCGGSYKGEVGNVYINNAGPDLAWVAPGSRAIFMTTDKSSAYAGYIFFTPGQHSSQSNTDSTIIPVGTSAQLYFSTPYTQPGFDTKQGGSRIPDGKYMMYVYINGYDEEGHTMLSTEYFGIVRVYSK